MSMTENNPAIQATVLNCTMVSACCGGSAENGSPVMEFPKLPRADNVFNFVQKGMPPGGKPKVESQDQPVSLGVPV